MPLRISVMIGFIVLLSSCSLIPSEIKAPINESSSTFSFSSSSSSSQIDEVAKWTATLRNEDLLVKKNGREDVIQRIANSDSGETRDGYLYLIGENAVYAVSNYFGNSVLNLVDQSSFTVLGNGYVKDRRTVLYTGGLKSEHPALNEVVKGADAQSFHIVEGKPYTAQDSVHKYTFAGQYIEGIDNIDYYIEGIHISDSDPQTFNSLGSGYAKDKNHVYCKQSILRDADPVTFESGTPTFWKDASHVFMYCTMLPELDPNTVEYFVPDVYLKDKNGIYDVNKLTNSCSFGSSGNSNSSSKH